MEDGSLTSLDKRKTRLVFTTCDTVRQRGRLREVVLECKPYFAMVRLAGTRTSFPISYATIFETAARKAAEKVRAEKKAKKEERRKR
jgi:hypothetical protein